jgi:hypothetical protein
MKMEQIKERERRKEKIKIERYTQITKIPCS